MATLLDLAIKDSVDRAFAKALAPEGWLRNQIRLHVRWVVWGFVPPFDIKHRAAFTATVAERIHERARKRLRLFGLSLWRVRYPMEWCAAEAEDIVTEWLKSDRIKFGDARYCWDDGRDVADEAMSYWDA
jgi:hypothetical protein